MGVSRGWRETCATLAYQGCTLQMVIASSVRLVGIKTTGVKVPVALVLLDDTLLRFSARQPVKLVQTARRCYQAEDTPLLIASRNVPKDSTDQKRVMNVLAVIVALTTIRLPGQTNVLRVREESTNLSKSSDFALLVVGVNGQTRLG